MIIDSEIVARKRAKWVGRANVDRFAEHIANGQSPQRLKDEIECDIVRRFMRGQRLLDVGIGTGRVSLPLLESGVRLTGVDASASMIERCSRDSRANAVRLVKGELEHLPFENESFDTVMSIDTLVHFPSWVANLDELLRVTCQGGRVIVDVGSRDHVDAVARHRGCTSDEIQTAELAAAEAYTLRLSSSELHDYAVKRRITLVALVPYGAVLGSLVANYWISESFAFRSGGIDRLVSWIGTDPMLFAFAQFIERRIVQQLAPSVTGRMFAVFTRESGGQPYRESRISAIAACDERGPEAWRADVNVYAEHERCRTFAVAFFLAAWPIRLAAAFRAELPGNVLHELDRTERAVQIDDICREVVGAWRSAAQQVAFHGVDLSDVFGTLLEGELRDRLEANE